MCTNQNEAREPETRSRGKKPQSRHEMTISELLSAISENEYPQYILDAIETVREWMNDMITRPEETIEETDIFSALFGANFDDDIGGIEGLFERLKNIENFADVIPNQKAPDGKPDTIIVSITPPDYDSGIRTAIDYAAVFNRPKCRRVWIISDTFIFDELIKFAPHVDALFEQGITLRYVLVTPWGWVELPLSGATASKRQFLWQTKEPDDTPKPSKPTRKRRQ